MIRVEGLTKDYGARRAIDNLYFDAGKGEILRFSWTQWRRKNHDHAYSDRIHAAYFR